MSQRRRSPRGSLPSMRISTVRLPRPPSLPRVPDSPVFTAAGSVWALLLGIGLLLLGNGLQSSLLGVRAADESFGSTVTGLVMSAYFVGFLVGSRLAPRTIRRVGHLRVFAAIASLASIAILIQSVFVTPAVWALMRVVTGYCLATAYIVTESWLNDRVTNEHRGGLLSVYMIVSYLGMGGGQLLLNTGDPGTPDLFILVSVLISFAAIPILLSLTPQPVQEAPERIGALALYRITPLGVAGSFATGILQGSAIGMGAVFGRTAGLSVAATSVFMFVMIAGPALLQWPVGKASDRVDRRKIIVWLAALGAVACVASVYAGGAWPSSLAGLAVLIGAGPMLLYSLFIAYTNDHLRPQQMVAASSTLTLVFGAGAVLGPSTAGLAMDLVGAPGFLWLLGGAQAGIAVFGLHRMRITDTRPADQQSPYTANPARTAALSPALAEVAAEAGADDEPEADTPGEGGTPS